MFYQNIKYPVYLSFLWQELVKYSMEVVKKFVFQLFMDVGVNVMSVYNYKMISPVIAVCPKS